MKIFDTTTALAAATLTAGQMVETKGYYSAGDGGGARYLISATASTTGAGDITLANGNYALLQLSSNVMRPQQFGARADGSTDDTAAFNAACEHLATYGDYRESVIDMGSGDYAVLGTVYVRKGQTLDGRGAHVFMSSTGQFKLGYKGDDTVDPSGHPVFVKDMWIEGGLAPINSLIAGYTVHNVFFSSPASGPIFGGTDGVITGCVFDNGSTLCKVTGKNINLTNCNFYIGTNQLDISTAKDSVVSNCVFNYASSSSIIWNGNTGTTLNNVRINNCSFKKNAQDTGTWNGFIWIRNVTAAPAGDLTISNCSFRNCHNAAIKNVGTGTHEVTIENCRFDGLKTDSAYAQSTTMYAIDMSGSAKGITRVDSCLFINLLAVPIQISTAEAADFTIRNSEFTNNTGTESINVTLTSGSAYFRMGNLKGDGKNLVDFDATSNAVFIVEGYLKDAWTLQNDGTYDYIVVPMSGATLLDVTLVHNQNPGGNPNYRFVENSLVGVSYDFAGGAIKTLVTNTPVFASASGLGFVADLLAAFNTPTGGTQLANHISPAYVALYWPQGNGNETIDVQYKLSTHL